MRRLDRDTARRWGIDADSPYEQTARTAISLSMVLSDHRISIRRPRTFRASVTSGANSLTAAVSNATPIERLSGCFGSLTAHQPARSPLRAPGSGRGARRVCRSNAPRSRGRSSRVFLDVGGVAPVPSDRDGRAPARPGFARLSVTGPDHISSGRVQRLVRSRPTVGGTARWQQAGGANVDLRPYAPGFDSTTLEGPVASTGGWPVPAPREMQA